MTYFSLSEAAVRYDTYRPKVHHVVRTWLKCEGIELEFKNALDVACGTGDSTKPLTEIADRTLGIDISDEMIEKAKEKNLNVKKHSYKDAHTLGKFDLISTCMAFHWFDATEAIESYKKASTEGAIWLIYNFSFGGNKDSSIFNNWFYEKYLKLYPSPPRGTHFAEINEGDKSLVKIASKEGVIPITLDKQELVKYLTTQSNIENAVINGKSYQEIEDDLSSQLSEFECSDIYKYLYRYDLYKYKSN